MCTAVLFSRIGKKYSKKNTVGKRKQKSANSLISGSRTLKAEV